MSQDFDEQDFNEKEPHWLDDWWEAQRAIKAEQDL